MREELAVALLPLSSGSITPIDWGAILFTGKHWGSAGLVFVPTRGPQHFWSDIVLGDFWEAGRVAQDPAKTSGPSSAQGGVSTNFGVFERNLIGSTP